MLPAAGVIGDAGDKAVAAVAEVHAPAIDAGDGLDAAVAQAGNAGDVAVGVGYLGQEQGRAAANDAAYSRCHALCWMFPQPVQATSILVDAGDELMKRFCPVNPRDQLIRRRVPIKAWIFAN